MTAQTPDEENGSVGESGFLDHFGELRTRLLRVLLVLAVVAVAGLPWAQELFALVSQPLATALPEGASMIATQVTSPLLTPIKLTLVLAAFATAPYLLWELWGFVAPGLYREEKLRVLPMLVVSVVMFYAGVASCWYAILPLLLKVLVVFTPEGVQMMTDIAQWVSFLLPLLFIFGIIFQIPVAMVLLSKTTGLSYATFARGRRYALVVSFVVAMLLTPPDPLSQLLLALPMYLLWETGTLVSWLLARRSNTGLEDPGGDGET